MQISGKIKLLIIIFVGALCFTACEKDDICIEPMTPKLVMGLFDYEHQDELKPVENLHLVAIGVEDTINFFNKDIVNIPLDVNNDNCRFALINDTNVDVLEFNYQRENVFVSKTCGYKTIFKNLNVYLEEDTDNWIKQIEIINHSIKIDTAVHVKIYH